MIESPVEGKPISAVAPIVTPRIKLRIIQPDGRRVLKVCDRLPVTFGRDRENDVALDDPNVSRRHAELRLGGGQLFIHDKKSLNGVKVNGESVMEARVGPGDLITLGDCDIQIIPADGTPDSSQQEFEGSDLRLSPRGTDGVLEIIRAIDLEGVIHRSATSDADWALRPLDVGDEAVGEHYQKLTKAYTNLLEVMNLVSNIGRHSHPQQICEIFVTALKKVFPLVENLAIVERPDDIAKTVSLIYQEGIGEDSMPMTHPSRTVLKRVVEELRAVYAVDARRDPRFSESDSLAARGVRSMMCAPLTARGEVYGALYVENRSQPYCFDHFDLNLLTVFAFHLGTALETARLLAERDKAFERAAESIKAVKQDKVALLLQYSQSEKKFRALFEQSALGAAVINLGTHRIEDTNDGLVRMLGYTRRQLASMLFEELLGEKDKHEAERWLKQVRQQGEGSTKCTLRTISGQQIVALQSCRALRVGENQVMVAYFIDITAKERAEAQMRLQLKRVTALSELSQELLSNLNSAAIVELLFEKVRHVFTIDRFAVATLVQERAKPVRLFSAERTGPDEFTRDIRDEEVDLPKDVSARVLGEKQTVRRSPIRPPSDPDSEIETYPHLSGGDVDSPNALYVPLVSQGRVTGVVWIENDEGGPYGSSHCETLRAMVAQAALALSNARAFESIRDQQENLRQLSLQIMTTQETERGRISRELHDGVGQQLTAMKYILEAMKNAARGGDADKTMARINEARELATQIIADLRNISLDLRPTMLDDLGLQPTLEWLVHQHKNRYDVAVELICDLGGEPIPPTIATAAFRIVQEAFGNAAKHSQATRIALKVKREPGRLRIIVEDNGVGFNPSELPRMQMTRGCSGMLNMKERAHFLGGDFHLDTAPAKGTRLNLTIPIKEKE